MRLNKPDALVERMADTMNELQLYQVGEDLRRATLLRQGFFQLEIDLYFDAARRLAAEKRRNAHG